MADQANGFFGLSVVRRGRPKPTVTVEPRWKGVVDLDVAHRELADVLDVWREVSRWPDSAPFTGGVFEAWPRRIAHGIAFLRAESQAILSYLMHLEG